MFSFRLRQVPIVRTRTTGDFRRAEEVRSAEALDLVWNFLLKNQDRFSEEMSDGPASVSSLRQEEIADTVGIPLHRVIEAIRILASEERLTILAQGPGKPNRYLLRRGSPSGQSRIAL